MLVFWVVASQPVVRLVVVALTFVGLAVSLFLVTVLFLD
jgi:hypothetical protein